MRGSVSSLTGRAGKEDISLRQRKVDLGASCRPVFERTGSAAASSAR
jgi:hypothetical protein